MLVPATSSARAFVSLAALANVAALAIFSSACGDDTTSSTESTSTTGSTTSTSSDGGGSSTTSTGGASDGGSTSSSSTSGGGLDIGQCKEGPAPGALCPQGGMVAPTGTYSDWSWPSNPSSLDWTLAIEEEMPDDGYYWAHQFGFAGPGADGGYLGLQMHGFYKADPPDGPVEITKMAVFAIAGGSLAAELGDVKYPDARTYSDFDGGSGWNIHVKYDWVKCRAYKLDVSPAGTDNDGNLWYGANVTDTVTDQKTFLGRILIPKQWGVFNNFSVMWSERFGYSQLTQCGDLQHSSVVFGYPTANGGTMSPTPGDNHFYNPPSCPSSRFTLLPNAVRQEMGVP